ncbi:MAG: insulinase family protein [Rubricoccaceae bacterium]
MRLVLSSLAAALLIAGCSPSPMVVSVEEDVLPPPTVETNVPPSDPLRFDPDVRTGVLPNGLTYYVLANQEPQNRAELRLVVNAGSILEEDDQRGLAHMLEHMAFNGTEKFPEQELVQYLESTGMQFGADVNAYTSFDETVYMLQVPTEDDSDIFETGLDVLREWAGNVTISDEEVEKERGVVLEEQRLGKGAFERIQDIQFPVLFNDSRYAERLPIGTAEVLETAPAQRLRDFYEMWYRPDLMAVVVVGDIDPDAVVDRIESRFASLESPARPEPRSAFEVPNHEETLFTIATDPELPQSRVSVVFKKDPSILRTDADLRRSFVQSLFSGMMNARLSELVRSETPPFAAAFAGIGGGVRTKDLAQLIAIIEADKAASGLDALVTEAERVRRFGFTETELERQKQEMLRRYEFALAEAATTPSRRYANQLVTAFLEGDVMVNIEDTEAAAREMLPTISLDEVNAVVSALLQTDSRVVQVSLPENDDTPVPTEAELGAALDGAQSKDLEPYVDTVSDAPLLAEVPAPGSVVSESTDAEFGVTTWTLSNGIRVILKPTDFRADLVQMLGYSPGGTSLVDDATYGATQLATAVIGSSGVGAFSETELEKKLAGKAVGVGPYISEDEEGIQGSASPSDIETLFQLTHLYATAPREDASALASLQQRYGALLANRSNSPEAAFQDTLTVALTQNHPRRQPFTMEVLERADLTQSMAFYRDRFADLDDFTFIFVGAFQPEDLKPHIETYLASLPSLPRTDVPRDVGDEYAEGVIKKVVRRGTEEKAQVSIVFSGPIEDYSFQKEAEIFALTDVLQTRLREDLREERGGVYYVSVSPSLTRTPRPRYDITVNFGTDPARVDELIGAVMDGIEAVQTEGPEQRYVDNVHEAARRDQETDLRDNDAWMAWLAESSRYTLPLSETVAQTTLQEAVTARDLQRAAQAYFNMDNYLQVVLVPETMTGPVGG